ncbi:MAG: hypothetical protein AAF828_01535 [Bacteroidota bacterium]
MSKNTKTTLPVPSPAVQQELISKAATAPAGFELKNWTFGTRINAGKFGIIDLDTLSPQRAGQLVDGGFKYLVRKK